MPPTAVTSSRSTPRELAIFFASRIFLRPQHVVDALIASFSDLREADESGSAAVLRKCYQKPLRMAATFEVFSLRMLHWPMLNLVDAAELQRREFADAMAAAVSAAWRGTHDGIA